VKAVLITGNPKYTNNKVAKDYYKSIVDFVNSLGVSCSVDPGADYTCPPPADFYIGHSRGVSRIRCFRDNPDMSNRFLRFGDPGGFNHPVDSEWLKSQKGNPPPEHFEFVDVQKEAIVKMVNSIKNTTTSMKW
jgi:hypothetical protein